MHFTIVPTHARLRALLSALFTLTLLASALVGCTRGEREETRLFQEAEALYSGGDYDGAAERYKAFLRAYPRSPFARTAKLRQRTIEREREAVMSTRGTNRPIYLQPTAEQSAALVREALTLSNEDPQHSLVDRAPVREAGEDVPPPVVVRAPGAADAPSNAAPSNAPAPGARSGAAPAATPAPSPKPSVPELRPEDTALVPRPNSLSPSSPRRP